MADLSSEPSPEEIAEMAKRVVSGSAKWLGAARQVSDAVPFMEHTRQTAQQLADAYTNSPTGYYRPSMREVFSGLKEAERAVQSYAFPPLNPVQVAVTGSAALSGAANFTMVILEDAARDSRTEAQNWAITFTEPVRAISNEEVNIAFVRKKLGCFSAGLAVEFDQSITEYRKCRAGTSPHISAGIALRNVLEEVNGQMIHAARTRGSAPNLTGWNDAAAVIARGAPGSSEVALLQAQKGIYDDLRANKLTPIAKNNRLPTGPEWDAIYSEYIRLLFAVVGLIDFLDGT